METRDVLGNRIHENLIPPNIFLINIAVSCRDSGNVGDADSPGSSRHINPAAAAAAEVEKSKNANFRIKHIWANSGNARHSLSDPEM